jgi:hypothetical protein
MEKAIVKKESKKKAVWAGSQVLMKKSETVKEEREKKMILLSSKVLGITPFGVNILGDLPYTNNLGLTQKANQYNRNIKYKYNWIKRSDNDTDKAICECKLVEVSKDGIVNDLCDWVTGECSPSTIKMRTLTGYQNHMAQTRAKNRAIQEVYKVKMHEEMMTNIRKMTEKKEINEEEASALSAIPAVSAEEINQNVEETVVYVDDSKAGESDLTAIIAQIRKCNDAKTLTVWTKHLVKDKKYSLIQKNLIQRAIDEQIKEAKK